jgi:hypothetical protein
MRKNYVKAHKGGATCITLYKINVRKKRFRIKGARGKKLSYANVFLTIIKASFIEKAIIEPPFDPAPSPLLHKQFRLGTFGESYNNEAT